MGLGLAALKTHRSTPAGLGRLSEAKRVERERRMQHQSRGRLAVETQKGKEVCDGKGNRNMLKSSNLDIREMGGAECSSYEYLLLEVEREGKKHKTLP